MPLRPPGGNRQGRLAQRPTGTKEKFMKKRILLVYPKFPSTYWGFEHSLKFIRKKTTYPPLGLLTVAALIPSDYEIKLVNLNIEHLKERDLENTDLVFISAMAVQKESFDELVKLSHKHGKTVVAGGPYPSISYETIEGVDHFVLDEAEITLPDFFRDLENGHPGKVYRSDKKPELGLAPIPRFDLINVNEYSSMAIQYSRGCPFNCEFCDIIELFGRVPRTKAPAQFLAELDALYETGYKGSVFIVDDNFIGNKVAVKDLLKSLADWQKDRKYPFTFMTEASVNLAADEELMDLMVGSNFYSVFLGIETPSEESLRHAGKTQNLKESLLESVRKIEKKGIEVAAGFILGFDTDRDDIFDRQIKFISDSAIPMAMVGLLTALDKTQLYRRLSAENRILHETDGNNTHALELNFIPKMPADRLIEGYKKVISTIYDPKVYFKRCFDLIMILPEHYQSTINMFTLSNILLYGYSLIRSLVLQGIFSSYGLAYFKFLAKIITHKPGRFPDAVKFAIVGCHFFKITDRQINKKMDLLENFKTYINKLRDNIQARINPNYGKNAIKDLFVLRNSTLSDLDRKYSSASKLSNQYAESTLGRLEESIGEYVSNIGQYLKDAVIRAGNINTGDLLKDIEKYINRMSVMIGENFPESRRFAAMAHSIDNVVLDLIILIANMAKAQTVKIQA